MPTPYDTFPSSWRGVPPAMPRGDYFVWQMFAPFAEQLWTSIAFDVELRDGAWPIVSTDPTMQSMWMRNTARRVDALAWANNVASIIEVRHAAAWQSMGQILGYADLWAKTYPNIPVNGLWLVTDSIPDDIRSVAAAQGIYVWTPENLTRPLKPRIVWPDGAVIADIPHQAF
jgi:hypothetical protein